MEKDPNKEVKMTIRRSRKFQRILNVLAVVLDIDRDEVVERAVRNYYKDQVDFIEKQVEKEEEPEVESNNRAHAA